MSVDRQGGLRWVVKTVTSGEGRNVDGRGIRSFFGDCGVEQGPRGVCEACSISDGQFFCG